MEPGVELDYLTTLFEVIGFCLIIIVAVYFLMKGIRNGDAQNRDRKKMSLKRE
ncbi:hypothetical protein V7056_14730 [Bacillus sp. JJ664]